jgi:hypothetical protein
MRVTNGIPLGSPLPLTVVIINHVEILKVTPLADGDVINFANYEVTVRFGTVPATYLVSAIKPWIPPFCHSALLQRSARYGCFVFAKRNLR